MHDQDRIRLGPSPSNLAQRVLDRDSHGGELSGIRDAAADHDHVGLGVRRAERGERDGEPAQDGVRAPRGTRAQGPLYGELLSDADCDHECRVLADDVIDRRSIVAVDRWIGGRAHEGP